MNSVYTAINDIPRYEAFQGTFEKHNFIKNVSLWVKGDHQTYHAKQYI